MLTLLSFLLNLDAVPSAPIAGMGAVLPIRISSPETRIPVMDDM